MLYIDVDRMVVGYALDAAVAAIKEHVQTGVDKVIIDVTNCPGGNSGAGISIMTALNMVMPSYAFFARDSALLREQKQVGQVGGFVDSPFRVIRNHKIQLLVFTNVNTFSSARQLAVGVQDGGLGLIVGQAPSNAPTAYGDMVSIVLPYSGIAIGISCTKWYRPDQNADQDTLHPDVSIPLDENIPTSALGLFQ